MPSHVLLYKKCEIITVFQILTTNYFISFFVISNVKLQFIERKHINLTFCIIRFTKFYFWRELEQFDTFQFYPIFSTNTQFFKNPNMRFFSTYRGTQHMSTPFENKKLRIKGLIDFVRVFRQYTMNVLDAFLPFDLIWFDLYVMFLEDKRKSELKNVNYNEYLYDWLNSN